VAQRGSAAGARSWAQMLDPYVKGRWREELLTVNYRTPTEIMALAADVLAVVAPDERPPESVHEEGVAPRVVQGLAAVADVVKEELAEMGAELGQGGRLAIIAPGNRIAELARALPEAVPGDRAEVLDSPVALLTVGQAKGLEFDRVVLADPAGILEQSPAGGNDLYVAITRATHRLTIVHDAPLPTPPSPPPPRDRPHRPPPHPPLPPHRTPRPLTSPAPPPRTMIMNSLRVYVPQTVH